VGYNFARCKFLRFLLRLNALLSHVIAMHVLAQFSHYSVHDCPEIHYGQAEVVLLRQGLELVQDCGLANAWDTGHNHCS
jgi:hypothetical protein